MAWLPKVHLGVIDDARERQRRRRLILATGAVVAAIAAAVALDPFAPDRPTNTTPPANLVPPRKVFSRGPYMGVSCSVPSSTLCDDIGLAVWLRRPAVAVRAELGGRWFSLDDRQWSGPAHGDRRTMFAGFLRHAGLRRSFGLPAHWEGQPPRSPFVKVRVDYGRGAPAETRVRLTLSPGWG